MIFFGVLVGLFTGNGETISKSIINSADSTVNMIIGLVGLMCFWCGVMKVAEKSGLTNKLAKVLRPILKLIFKEAPKAFSSLDASLLLPLIYEEWILCKFQLHYLHKWIAVLAEKRV